MNLAALYLALAAQPVLVPVPASPPAAVAAARYQNVEAIADTMSNLFHTATPIRDYVDEVGTADSEAHHAVRVLYRVRMAELIRQRREAIAAYQTDRGSFPTYRAPRHL